MKEDSYDGDIIYGEDLINQAVEGEINLKLLLDSLFEVLNKAYSDDEDLEPEED